MEDKILHGQLHKDVQFYWLDNNQEFVRSYYGNDVMYWQDTISEWVSPEGASFYPLEITKASHAW